MSKECVITFVIIHNCSGAEVGKGIKVNAFGQERFFIGCMFPSSKNLTDLDRWISVSDFWPEKLKDVVNFIMMERYSNISIYDLKCSDFHYFIGNDEVEATFISPLLIDFHSNKEEE